MDRLGIIAGEGSLPIQVIEYCNKRNIEPYILKITSETDATYQQYKNMLYIKVGMIGEAIAYLKSHQIKEIIFAGRVERPDSIFKLKVDAKGAKLLASLAINKIFGDNNILLKVKDFFIAEGFYLISLNEFMKDELFFKPGVISKLKPNNDDNHNIELGRDLIKTISGFDVGQAVVVEEKRIIAIEGAEGTDNMIERCASLVKGGACLIKFSKIDQITEVDLPCIGVETIKKAHLAKIKVIAIEAGKTIVINKDEVLEYINSKKMKLVALDKV